MGAGTTHLHQGPRLRTTTDAFISCTVTILLIHLMPHAVTLYIGIYVTSCVCV